MMPLTLWLEPTIPSLGLYIWARIGHALSCLTGGYPPIHHNKLRHYGRPIKRGMQWCHCGTTSATIHKRSAWHENKHKWGGGQTGSKCQKLSGSRFEQAFLDVRVSTLVPQTTSPSKLQPSTTGKNIKGTEHMRSKSEKLRASVTLLVVAASDGIGKAATVFYMQLADF